MDHDHTDDIRADPDEEYQSLHDQEAKFFLASITNTLQDSVVTLNLDGVITSWNGAAERVYGFPAKEAIGRSLAMVTLQKDFVGLIDKIEAIRNGETVPLYDTIRLHKGGRLLHLEITMSPVQNDKGQVIGVSTIARDVTEVRQAQGALTASEYQLRAILETVIDFAIITLDPHGHIIEWNRGAERMFGYRREEAIGQHTEIIFTPEDIAGGIPQVEIDIARITGRSIDERWHLRRDQTRFFMSGVMTPIEEGPAGFVKVARNITDRKLAEEALMLSEDRKSMAVQSAGMGEWEWDLQTNQVSISDEVAVLFGLNQRGAQTSSNVLLEQVYPPDREIVSQQLQTSVNGLNIFQAEYRIVRQDNQEVKWVNAYGRVVAHQNAEASKMIGVIYDITARKLLEKQKDDFISLASHELKTPVTAIKAYSELLEENFAGDREEGNVKMLRKINEQVDRLISLIQTLLDTSTLTEGKMQLYPETFDVNAIIEEHVQVLQSISPAHRIHWRPSPVGLVHADKNRIIQVVTNFVSNAVKYSPEGSDVIVSTKDRLDAVVVSVQDFGPGIPPEAQPYIFDRYYRVPAQQHRKDGFGLGLYICAAIVRQHFGTIGVETNSGDGATFYFTLPYS